MKKQNIKKEILAFVHGVKAKARVDSLLIDLEIISRQEAAEDAIKILTNE